jgi:hypothetical protein
MPLAPSANADSVSAGIPAIARAHCAARACLAALQGGQAGATPSKTGHSSRHCSAEPAVHQNRYLTGE